MATGTGNARLVGVTAWPALAPVTALSAWPACASVGVIIIERRNRNLDRPTCHICGERGAVASLPTSSAGTALAGRRHFRLWHHLRRCRRFRRCRQFRRWPPIGAAGAAIAGMATTATLASGPAAAANPADETCTAFPARSAIGEVSLQHRARDRDTAAGSEVDRRAKAIATLSAVSAIAGLSAGATVGPVRPGTADRTTATGATRLPCTPTPFPPRPPIPPVPPAPPGPPAAHTEEADRYVSATSAPGPLRPHAPDCC